MKKRPPGPENGLTAWALTTGEDGMRTQARGLAHAVAARVVEKQVPRAGALDWLRGQFGRPRLPDDVAAPWPDVLVTCGRRSVPYAVAIRRASLGRTVAVHVQDPRAHHDRFDLVVAMAHDRLPAGPRVMKISTALHDVTAASLDGAAREWRPRLEPLGRPLAGVAVGGDLRGRPFTLADAGRLIAGLRRLRAAGIALAVTPSRRTPGVVRTLIAETFADDPSVFVWDLAGGNPYRGILALADRLVVTTDSVSMVSEAIATGHPVELLDLGFPRHRGFVQGLVDQGFARRFQGDPVPPPPPPPSDPTARVAERVRRLVQARTGVSG
jgi:mitochondrial fission protein ELM1